MWCTSRRANCNCERQIVFNEAPLWAATPFYRQDSINQVFFYKFIKLKFCNQVMRLAYYRFPNHITSVFTSKIPITHTPSSTPLSPAQQISWRIRKHLANGGTNPHYPSEIVRTPLLCRNPAWDEVQLTTTCGPLRASMESHKTTACNVSILNTLAPKSWLNRLIAFFCDFELKIFQKQFQLFAVA